MFLQADPVAPGMIQLLMPFVILMVVFYFFLWRPQQQKQKAWQVMVDALKKGDSVVTIGGIHGEVVSMKDDHVVLKVADKVEIKVARSGISSVKK